MGGVLYRRAGELAVLCDQAGEDVLVGSGREMNHERWWLYTPMESAMTMLMIYELRLQIYGTTLPLESSFKSCFCRVPSDPLFILAPGWTMVLTCRSHVPC